VSGTASHPKSRFFIITRYRFRVGNVSRRDQNAPRRREPCVAAAKAADKLLAYSQTLLPAKEQGTPVGSELDIIEGAALGIAMGTPAGAAVGAAEIMQ
jgi:hypothetical protein